MEPHNRWYNLAIASYVIVIGHYVSELVYYRTTKINAAFISPMIVGCELSEQEG